MRTWIKDRTAAFTDADWFTAWGQEVVPGIVPGDRIIMGDGILQAYDELGYGDIARQGVVAHELGHHVQFWMGMITPIQRRRAAASACQLQETSRPRRKVLGARAFQQIVDAALPTIVAPDKAKVA
ncbi:neutral zinc metallopeptidase [Arsenicicoccus dermatophilus]|uniref:neutral zinc metallopeptidase n=1 Tax=Arsenicicoccus dermatophilus TaxID=1076331 RepID=UPI001F4C9978|nr:neutral zinc metallopeptidase [Arsenicicoccus dermatophilus]MCH8611509.1 neutral zinc metallopeptidase [Arsenicicoccus dermatophilus]